MLGMFLLAGRLDTHLPVFGIQINQGGLNTFANTVVCLLIVCISFRYMDLVQFLCTISKALIQAIFFFLCAQPDSNGIIP